MNRRIARYAYFFGEGQKRDERTNGQTHIGGWVENLVNYFGEVLARREALEEEEEKEEE